MLPEYNCCRKKSESSKVGSVAKFTICSIPPPFQFKARFLWGGKGAGRLKVTYILFPVFPPSFAALALVPFNINPHYIDTDPDSTHKVLHMAIRTGTWVFYIRNVLVKKTRYFNLLRMPLVLCKENKFLKGLKMTQLS